MVHPNKVIEPAVCKGTISERMRYMAAAVVMKATVKLVAPWGDEQDLTACEIALYAHLFELTFHSEPVAQAGLSQLNAEDYQEFDRWAPSVLAVAFGLARATRSRLTS
jgi:hypothetical protein